MGSGIMQITYILYDASRKDMLDVVVNAGTGSYLQKRYAHNIRMQAYRMEVFTNPGNLTVDGEVVETHTRAS